MSKITIRVIQDGEGHAEIRACEGETLLASGNVGGEPEDNLIYRDYKWIVPMLKTLGERLGAEVEVVETTDPICQDCLDHKSECRCAKGGAS